LLPLDCREAEERYRIEPSHRLSPDRLYDRAWAVTLLERVVGKLESAHAGNAAFAKLKPCLTAGREALDYAAVAAELGMSEGGARVAAHRLRRHYRDLLRAEIAETLDEPDEFGDELQALYRAFSD
jgi:RNA polymerase sigma-70 factor (ECF subfamily)